MSDDFTRHIFEIIISKVAQAKGFSTISESALNIFVEVVIERLSQYARSAAHLTNHCGRTDTNGFDVFEALSKFNESPETLASFINSMESIPPFEFLVEPYPLPRLSRFYKDNPNQTNQSEWNAVLPFRANSCIPSYEKSSPSIPSFFPSMPNKYTYDQTIQPDPVGDDPEMSKKHETDQELIQKALASILVCRGNDQSHAVHFDSKLTRLASNALISKPTDMIDSPIYSVECDRPDVNPEFLPLIEVKEDTFSNNDATGNNRDVFNMAQILAIKHGTTEPGTLKSSTLNAQQPSSSDIKSEKPQPSSP